MEMVSQASWIKRLLYGNVMNDDSYMSQMFYDEYFIHIGQKGYFI